MAVLAPSRADTDTPNDDAPRRKGALQAFGAFGIYLVASIVVWGGSTTLHLATMYIPRQDSSDSDFFRWAMAWVPWAIRHGQDPLTTTAVFAPYKASLTWVTMVPGPAIAMWPVTALFGSLASYNVLVLLAPALDGWATYLLCRRLTQRFWASLVGGFFFGFSAYIAIQMNHPNLSLLFPIPLAVYLVVRRLEESIRPVPFVIALTATLVALWSISIEMFATAVLFAAIALVIALVLAGEERHRLWAAIALIGIAYILVGAIVFVPYLLPAFRHAPEGLMHDPENRYEDLLRFVLPRDSQVIGGAWLESVAARHTDPASGGSSFLGIGVIAMLVGFGITERHRRGTWGLLAFVGSAAVLSMGPSLWIAGHRLMPLPAAILVRAPLLRQAIPGRNIAYATLGIAVIAALWLARADGRWAWARWALAVVSIALIIPSIPSPPWHVPDTTPAFFTNGSYAEQLHQGETVLVIPAKLNQEMAWQAEAGFWFRMPSGYVGSIPVGIPKDALTRGLRPDTAARVTPEQLRASFEDRDVTAVVLEDNAPALYADLLHAIGFAPVYTGGGVSVWRGA